MANCEVCGKPMLASPVLPNEDGTYGKAGDPVEVCPDHSVDDRRKKVAGSKSASELLAEAVAIRATRQADEDRAKAALLRDREV